MALTGQVAIVTGSSSGIGESIARRLSASGVKVVVNSSKSAASGEQIASELADSIYIQGSIAADGFAEMLVTKTLERYGRLDILINNAGTTRVIPHSDTDQATLEVWREIFEVNVFGTWELIRQARSALESTGDGKVINITSLAGVRPTGSSIPYASSKAALNHMTLLLAATLGPKVRVNAIAPGLVDTPWTEDWDQIRTNYSKTAPMLRSAKPEDVSKAAVALLENDYITGQILLLDGGFSLRH